MADPQIHIRLAELRPLVEQAIDAMTSGPNWADYARDIVLGARELTVTRKRRRRAS